jgi:diguanylate cyclase (GGDEF)-like protein/PAS domain S-box-containing protein
MRAKSSGGSESGRLLTRYGAELGRILDRGLAEVALERQTRIERLDALMRNIVQQSFDGILSFGEDGRVATANQAALKIFGYDRRALVGLHFARLFPDLGAYQRLGLGADALNGDRLEGMALRQGGEAFPVDLSLRTTMIGGSRCLIAIVRDITHAKSQEERLKHLAWHDALTDLPNRVLLKDRLEQALSIAERREQPLALLLLDLDRFKEVNDTLGHQVGDLLLVDLAKRLNTCIRRSDTIARLGGDEFAILLPAPSPRSRALEVAQRIVDAVKQPFEVIDGLKLEVGISIGIATYPDHATSEAKLMQFADIAMYAAKRGPEPVETYDRHTNFNTVRFLTLSGELRQAIEQGQLSFEFQPKLDLLADRIVSAEALARWLHPTQGAIPPGEFIPQAEHTGMIQPFTRWSIDAAFAHLAAWRACGREISLALNLSARSVHDDELVETARALLERWRIDPARITLELTESAVMLDPDGALINLRRMHELGFRLSIDDFGTGYSSLSHLQRLPLDELKIDQTFVVNLETKQQDLVIVRSTIDLAHNLGLKVVAEGVETQEHIRLLKDLGCDYAQGYMIAEPMPADVLAGWFETCGWTVGTEIEEGVSPL